MRCVYHTLYTPEPLLIDFDIRGYSIDESIKSIDPEYRRDIRYQRNLKNGNRPGLKQSSFFRKTMINQVRERADKRGQREK